MFIARAPIMGDRYCKSLSFIADLKSIRPRRKDGSDVPSRYSEALSSFLSDVNAKVLGVNYISLTGRTLPATLNLIKAEGVQPWRVEALIECPLTFQFDTFQSIITASWKALALSGTALFVGHGGAANDRSAMTMRDATQDRRGSWWKDTFG